MAKIIFRSILWGFLSWVVLSFFIFFGSGIYAGFVARNVNSSISGALNFSLRYGALFVGLVVAAYFLLNGEKNYKKEVSLKTSEPAPTPSAPPASAVVPSPVPKAPVSVPKPEEAPPKVAEKKPEEPFFSKPLVSNVPLEKEKPDFLDSRFTKPNTHPDSKVDDVHSAWPVRNIGGMANNATEKYSDIDTGDKQNPEIM